MVLQLHEQQMFVFYDRVYLPVKITATVFPKTRQQNGVPERVIGTSANPDPEEQTAS